MILKGKYSFDKSMAVRVAGIDSPGFRCTKLTPGPVPRSEQVLQAAFREMLDALNSANRLGARPAMRPRAANPSKSPVPGPETELPEETDSCQPTGGEISSRLVAASHPHPYGEGSSAGSMDSVDSFDVSREFELKCLKIMNRRLLDPWWTPSSILPPIQE